MYEHYTPFDLFINQINWCRRFYSMLHYTNGENKTEQIPAIMITKTNTKFTAGKETKLSTRKNDWGYGAYLQGYFGFANTWTFETDDCSSHHCCTELANSFSSRQCRPWFAPSYLRISTIANQSTPNQLATLPSIWHFSGLQLAQNWHQNVWDLRRNVTQYYNCMMHVLAKIKSHETRYVGLHFRVCLHKWRWIGRGPKGHQEPTALQWPNPKPTLSVRTGVTYGYGYLFSQIDGVAWLDWFTPD